MGRRRELENLYEDEIRLAVLKPAGLATQALPGIDSLELRFGVARPAGCGSGGRGR